MSDKERESWCPFPLSDGPRLLIFQAQFLSERVRTVTLLEREMARREPAIQVRERP
jgi:hypothetical protein